MADDYECRECGQPMYVPDGCDELEPEVRYCPECAANEILRLRGLLEVR
jgi:hypothetical protein